VSPNACHAFAMRTPRKISKVANNVCDLSTTLGVNLRCSGKQGSHMQAISVIKLNPELSSVVG
jgi:hypothetical protein